MYKTLLLFGKRANARGFGSLAAPAQNVGESIATAVIGGKSFVHLLAG